MRGGIALAVCALVAVGCGGEGPSGERPDRDRGADADPFAAVQRGEGRTRPARAAPRWESVATLGGDGSATRTLDIAPKAIQWRARWSCRSGELELTVRSRPARDARRLASGSCPGAGEGTDVRSGRIELAVRATAPWRARIEQQVDTPMREPPLEAVRRGEARRLAAGRFYRLERRGRGRAVLDRLPDGRLALRFEGFHVPASADLFVWVSRARRPRTSRRVLESRYTEIAPLKATAGTQNYVLPRTLAERDVRSVVIWCAPLRIAYAAAALDG